MKDIRIKIEKQTSKVFPDGDILGISNENLQGSIICYFDEFVDGTAWLEVQMPDKTKGYFMMYKVDETYVLPIKSSLLSQAGLINMQLRITQDESIEEIPVYKSNIFYCKVKEAINSTSQIPDEYPQWIDIANVKLQEIDNLDISATKVEKTATITITKKDGTEETTEIYDGNDYILTDEDKEEIVDTVKPMVEESIQPTLENIEEVAETAESIAKGANQALSFGDYATMINIFNALGNDIYRTGQNVLIVTLNVPDLWVSDVAEESISYTYTTDEDLTTLLKEQGYIQVGYYKLSALETQKVDLTDYVKNTDYATNTKGGIIKTYSNYGTQMINGELLSCVTKTYEQYKNISPGMFVGKGTLENIFNARFVTLTQAEYDILEETGTVTTEDGTTYTYDEETEYSIVEE